MASTASAGKDATSAKVQIPAADKSRVEKMRAITEDLLKTYFPILAKGPDAMYWLMATWGAESSWRLHFNKGSRSSPVMTSLHYTPSPPARESIKDPGSVKSTGTLTGNGYQYSNVIQNLWNNPLTTTTIKENIKEGWYPHGISACMGSYHVRGCPNNTGEWRFYEESKKLLGSGILLEVDPGQSIFETLFKDADSEECWRRSIAAGINIFNYKYRRALEKTHRGNEAGAMQMAVGNFLGKFGSRDANGVSPEDRVRQLNQTGGNIVTMLQAVNLRRTGDNTTLAYEIDTSNKEAKSSGSTQVSNTQTRVATTNGNSGGDSKKTPGCSTA